jgi:ADP-ribose pyrophosphatase YjhB (NUDIX family)
MGLVAKLRSAAIRDVSPDILIYIIFGALVVGAPIAAFLLVGRSPPESFMRRWRRRLGLRPRHGFRIVDKGVAVVDERSGVALRQCRPRITEVVELVPMDAGVVVREFWHPHPHDKSNVYFLDNALQKKWRAQRSPSGHYERVRFEGGRLLATTSMADTCELDQTTGHILHVQKWVPRQCGCAFWRMSDGARMSTGQCRNTALPGRGLCDVCDDAPIHDHCVRCGALAYGKDMNAEGGGALCDVCIAQDELTANPSIVATTRDPIPTQHTALVIVRDGDRCLLVQERESAWRRPDDPLCWYVPSARATPGESLVESAERATVGDIGLSVRLVGLLRIFHDPGPLFTRVTAAFLGELRADVPPRAVKDARPFRTEWVAVNDLGRFPMRRSDAADTIAALLRNSAPVPLELIQTEGAPWQR